MAVWQDFSPTVVVAGTRRKKRAATSLSASWKMLLSGCKDAHPNKGDFQLEHWRLGARSPRSLELPNCPPVLRDGKQPD
ncbi:hypothetical protein QN382_17545 [Pseudomonas sp. 10B1]|uniref:hypothetical protein n=1 Tax=unclassified Pseudomonas TaxID=196821 RepID=UPI002AB5815E|nr:MULTISPECIES: hypothetical protein [unclassified Pseudomonas]MDY7560456.1 hypothetical protein [Pseudomonas sp. AB6]MEA9975948.1 hypothetical protein [Pseudomonas sp. RTS4]MEA9993213.1 hypothetical protein [Pseudomonas sp. AA4]MEB0088037.1 hypothetical protein [Pseudomonas sp. RTI1]MEB0124300.1 hypothetical protein [Pseudomonas sp. CCC1.2]